MDRTNGVHVQRCCNCRRIFVAAEFVTVICYGHHDGWVIYSLCQDCYYALRLHLTQWTGGVLVHDEEENEFVQVMIE